MCGPYCRLEGIPSGPLTVPIEVPDVTANQQNCTSRCVACNSGETLSVIAFRVCLHPFVSDVHCQTLYIKMQIIFQKVISQDVFRMSPLLALSF